MSREILFRGMDENGRFIYGDYVHHGCAPTIVNAQSGVSGIVDPLTVGQFTGLLDKNGENVYYGDLIRVNAPDKSGRYFAGTAEVTWDTYDTRVRFLTYDDDVKLDVLDRALLWHCYASEYIERIGTIHDQPADKEE